MNAEHEPVKGRLAHAVFSVFFVFSGGAEHQTAVLHVPLAHLVALSGVPSARRHPDLGHPVLRPGPVPLPYPGLLRHAHVSFHWEPCITQHSFWLFM